MCETNFWLVVDGCPVVASLLVPYSVVINLVIVAANVVRIVGVDLIKLRSQTLHLALECFHLLLTTLLHITTSCYIDGGKGPQAPHHCPALIVQSYLPGGAHVYPNLTHGSLGPCDIPDVVEIGSTIFAGLTSVINIQINKHTDRETMSRCVLTCTTSCTECWHAG